MFRYWYIPLNVSVLDFVKVLHEQDTIDIRQFSNYKYAAGDIAYIYSGAPYGQFLYLCEIIETDIPFENADVKNEYRPKPQKPTYNNWMRLKVLKSVPAGTPSLQAAPFTNSGFMLGKYPKTIKDTEVLVYLNQEFDKYNCE